MNNCGNCRFWNDCLGYGRGQCRKHAPITRPIDSAYVALWPETTCSDWCGDFELRPEFRPCKTCDKLVGSEAFSAPHLQHVTLYPICKECYDHFAAGTHPLQQQEKKRTASQCSHQFVNSDYRANTHTCAQCGAALEPVGTKDWKVKA